MYVLIDNTNHIVRCVETYYEADCMRASVGRPDWLIAQYHKADYISTDKQRNAIRFCECVLGIKFTGIIESGKDCSEFLSQYLEQAKQFYSEIKCEYEADRGY